MKTPVLPRRHPSNLQTARPPPPVRRHRPHRRRLRALSRRSSGSRSPPICCPKPNLCLGRLDSTQIPSLRALPQHLQTMPPHWQQSSRHTVLRRDYPTGSPCPSPTKHSSKRPIHPIPPGPSHSNGALPRPKIFETDPCLVSTIIPTCPRAPQLEPLLLAHIDTMMMLSQAI